MNNSIYNINLDIHDPNTQCVLYVKQNDNGRSVRINLMDSGRPYALSSDCTAVLRAKKPDGTILYNACTIVDNYIGYQLTNQTSASVGMVDCEVRVTGSDSRQITSPRFSLLVQDIIYSDSEIESQDEFTQLTQAITQTNRLNISASKSGNVATVTVTHKDNTTTSVHISDGTDGSDGEDGEDGVSPTTSITDITHGHRLTIVGADGTHTCDIMDGTATTSADVITALGYTPADEDAVPTKTSELTNDSGFLTSHQSLSAYRPSAEQDIIDAGKIGDAPSDNKQYARKNASWVEVTGGGGGTSDFDELTNRPKYNGIDMTHSTNIPEVKTAVWDAKSDFSGAYADLTGKPSIPSKTSDLTNDSGFLTAHQSLAGYATETWVEDKGYLTEHQSLSAYRTASAQDVIDATKASASDVDAIDALIPAQATSSNQLGDKNFINSSIATNTAYYISNNGEPFDSLAQLQAYSGTVTNNDYAFIVGTDSEGNTYYDRYKATVSGSTVTWAKEYRLNNSSFTAAQWATVQSGLTSSDKTKLDGIESGADVTDAANVQSAGAVMGVRVAGTDLGKDASGKVNVPHASDSSAGTFKTSYSFGTLMRADGILTANVLTYANYPLYTGNTFIGKGTLENIKEDIVSRAGAEFTSNKVTSLSSSSTDTQYPSAKCVHDIVGNKEDKGKLTINGTEYTLAISTTDAGTAGYITFVVEE